MNKNEFIDKPGRRIIKGLLHKNDGFTLIELLIAMAVFSIISLAIMAVFDSFQRGYTTQQATLDVVQKARSALSFMAYDIKQAGLDPRESDNFKVRKASATEFTFDFDSPDSYGKFDGKLDISTATERRTYKLSGGKLYQINNASNPDNVPIPSSSDLDKILLPGVLTANAESRFEYIDNDRNTMTVPVSATDLRLIRGVRVVLTVSESSGRGNTLSRTMDTMVLCRNLLFNDNRSKTN